MARIPIVLLLILSSCTAVSDTVQIGFVGAMSGPVAQYGSYEAALLAVEHINAEGGINGKTVELIAEDGACDPKIAVSAINKLLFVHNVRIIAGGHCTPESLAIAPIVQGNDAVMLASISTGPALSDFGDRVFRTTPVSTVQADMLAAYACKWFSDAVFALVYQESDYARPIANSFEQAFSDCGGKINFVDTYELSEIDFRSSITKLQVHEVDVLVVSFHSIDSSHAFMKQLFELGIQDLPILANDVVVFPRNIEKDSILYENVIFASPKFNESSPRTKKFIDSYNKRFRTNSVPFGFFTAESYDGVRILADAMREGEDPETVRQYLKNVDGYIGISGSLTIDNSGDGIREYTLLQIRNGKAIPPEKY